MGYIMKPFSGFKNIGGSLKDKYGGSEQTTNKEGKFKYDAPKGLTQEQRSDLQKLRKFDPKKPGSPSFFKKTTNIPEDTNVGGSGKETSGKYKGMSNNREDYTSTYNFVNRHVHFAEKNRLKAKKNSK